MAKINYIKGDLFNAPPQYWLVHCISADFAMGAGIAKRFTEEGAKLVLKAVHSDYKWRGVGDCLPIVGCCGHRGVFNLVTKERYYYKPTYNTLTQALQNIIIALDDPFVLPVVGEGKIKLAMPKIGCGLDRLEWSKVEKIIEDTFDDRFEIYVYEL